MSSQLATLLNAAAATGYGTTLDLTAIDSYLGGTVSLEVTGTFVATVAIEGTVDGVNWHALGTYTTPGMATISGMFHSLRANVTAYTSGDVTLVVRYGVIPNIVALKTNVDQALANTATLLTRLTAVRAALLDSLVNLDTAVAPINKAAESIRKMLAVYHRTP